MLILILTNVQYSHKATFSFKKRFEWSRLLLFSFPSPSKKNPPLHNAIWKTLLHIYMLSSKQCALPVITTLFSWKHIYYAHLASVRFEHSVCRGPLMTTIYIYPFFQLQEIYFSSVYIFDHWALLLYYKFVTLVYIYIYRYIYTQSIGHTGK